ncbi:PDZ domain-containing protein [uncultured Chryseobacterium sp.]|uniref:PDZ domain-containing protein n=1 Tax=uncultured Chryseobacterium sp. TaxID=259322 RepID=UPI002606560A|nr:PDZ domain-containing protein [uncultured Chryseobacterium sp.]
MKFIKLLLLLFSVQFFSQSGFQLIENKKTVIPFKLINNLIFIPVQVNGVELTFMIDSGVSETLLFSLENKEVNFADVEKMKFTGLGGDIEIEGLKAINNQVQIGKNYIDKQHQIFIILNEEFNFSSHVGIPVNGIIGYHFFKNHQVKIDYINKKITIFESEKKFEKESSKYDLEPISVELNKPYITATVEQISNPVSSKMLIDLGNSDAIWLFPSVIPGFSYNRPNIDDYLGRGFNGDVYGKRSRIHNLFLGKYQIEKPLVAMPDEYSIQHLKLVKDRKGSIGSETLRRFNLIFDYPNGKLYFKKNKNFNDPFHFNMSGLDIKHDGMIWTSALVEVENKKNSPTKSENIEVYSTQNKFQYKFVLKPVYSVAGSRPDSPAYIAGIRKDDKLISINKKRTTDMSLEEINELFKSEEGKHISLEVSRNGTLLTYNFELEDPIPYQDQ